MPGLLDSRGRHRLRRGGQQTIGGLDDRQGVTLEGEAHHRPTHHQTGDAARRRSSQAQQVTDGGAQAGLDVVRVLQGLAGQGDDPRDHRLAEAHRTLHRAHGARIVHHHADIRGQAATGHFAARQQLDQLLLTAGGVLGRHHHDFQT